VDTDGKTIAANPGAWDGKWVRVHGVLSERRQILYTESNAARLAEYPQDSTVHEGSLYLDPAHFDLDADQTYERDEPGEAALVSGRVRTDCWKFWEPWNAIGRDYAERDMIFMVHPQAPENIRHCNLVAGPYLERVVAEPLTRTAQ
jgi:hypothetical protein